MGWWNFGGLNPNFKEFSEKYPKMTVIGLAWATYWRFALLIIAIETILFTTFALIAVLFSSH